MSDTPRRGWLWAMIAATVAISAYGAWGIYDRTTNPFVSARASGRANIVALCPASALRGCVLEVGGRRETRGLTVGNLEPLNCSEAFAEGDRDCLAAENIDRCHADHQMYTARMPWARTDARLQPNEYRLTCANGHSDGRFSGAPLFGW